MSETTMVERVARAIGEELFGYVDADGTPNTWGTSLVLAHAAIAAMREPTEAMVDLGLHDSEGFNLLGVNENSLAAAWMRMVDAALENSPETGSK